jgi:hypothetical protein
MWWWHESHQDCLYSSSSYVFCYYLSFIFFILLLPHFFQLLFFFSSFFIYFFNFLIIIYLHSFYSFLSHFLNCMCRDSSVGVVTRLRTVSPRDPVSIPSSGKNFFSFPKIPFRLWSPLSLRQERYPGGMETKARSWLVTPLLYPNSLHWDNISFTFSPFLHRHFSLTSIISSFPTYFILFFRLINLTSYSLLFDWAQIWADILAGI